MCSQPNIASTAFLIADPARASMLMALVDGRALPAGELAYAAGVTAQTASTHLAGQLGVAVTQALERRGVIVAAADKQFEVSPAGMKWFARMGLNVPDLQPTRRGLARQCFDWSERQHHLAGPLGVQWMKLLCAKGWLRRVKATRTVQVTPQGWAWLKDELGIEGRLGELSVDDRRVELAPEA